MRCVGLYFDEGEDEKERCLGVVDRVHVEGMLAITTPETVAAKGLCPKMVSLDMNRSMTRAQQLSYTIVSSISFRSGLASIVLNSLGSSNSFEATCSKRC